MFRLDLMEPEAKDAVMAAVSYRLIRFILVAAAAAVCS